MKKTLISCAAFCALLPLSSLPALANAEAQASGSSDVPVLAPAPSLPKKPLISPANGTKYSLMSLILGGQASTVYNSNIYRSSTQEESDVIATVSPKLAVESNFSRHAASLSITPEAGRYLSESKNNYVDWDVEAEGLYEASLTDALSLNAAYRRGHVAIGAFDDDTSAELSEPVIYDLFETGALWEGSKNLLHYALQGDWQSYDYDDTARENGAISVQDDRDHDRYETVGKIGYEFIPSYVFYVRGAWNDRRYDHRIDSSLLYPRDSDGYEAAIGISRDTPQAPYGFDIYAGYLNQNYDASQLEDVDGLDVSLKAHWNITDADLLKLRLDREVKDSQTDGVSSSLRTRFDADFTHSYTEKFSTGIGLGYTNDDYQSNVALAGIDRQDHIYDASLNARYVIYRDISLKLEYAYRNRESNKELTDYDAHILGLSLSAKY